MWFVHWTERDTGRDDGSTVGGLSIGPYPEDPADAFAFSETFGSDGPPPAVEARFAAMAAAEDLARSLDEVVRLLDEVVIRHGVVVGRYLRTRIAAETDAAKKALAAARPPA